MGRKLPEDQMRLYRRIDEALFFIWDPIGVSDSAWARDEYQSYLPAVFRSVMQKSPREELIEHLIELEAIHMGMGKKFGMKKRISSFVDLLYDMRDATIDDNNATNKNA